MTVPTRRTLPLDKQEALRLLGSVSLGRIAFTANALPEIRPVNHILDRDEIIIRSHVGAAILATHGQIVSYEADMLEPDTHLGWSVVVLGKARVLSDPEALRRYRDLVRPWVDRQMDYVIRIRPQRVTGYQVTDGEQVATG